MPTTTTRITPCEVIEGPPKIRDRADDGTRLTQPVLYERYSKQVTAPVCYRQFRRRLNKSGVEHAPPSTFQPWPGYTLSDLDYMVWLHDFLLCYPRSNIKIAADYHDALIKENKDNA